MKGQRYLAEDNCQRIRDKCYDYARNNVQEENIEDEYRFGSEYYSEYYKHSYKYPPIFHDCTMKR